MKKIFVIICAAALTLAGCAQQEKKTEDTPLAYAAEPDGFKVVEFDQVFGDVRMMGVSELHSMIVMQHGEVIYEKYAVGQDPDYLHILWSASKTFTATAIGFAVQDGLLSVDDKVLKFFPDEAPAEQSKWLKALSVKDLLTMSSGIRKDYLCPIEAHRIKSPVDSILAEPFIFEPGSVFRYNSSNTYLLSAIITKVTGKKLEEYLDEKLFTPLGIRNHSWEVSDEGYNMGGWGLHVTTRSFAKMGQFFLQKGSWDGKQLLPEAWIADAMAAQIDNSNAGSHPDASAGYGYQMWCCHTPGAARLDGAWGQFSIILPDKDAVVTVNAHMGGNSYRLIDSIYEHVYPNL